MDDPANTQHCELKKPYPHEHCIYVIFDGLTEEEFIERLRWDYLVKAWSKTISWRFISSNTIILELSGIDNLPSITVTRRHIGGKIYIAARNDRAKLLQTGVWWYDHVSTTCCCARRIYDKQLAETLRERLPDFCFNTFVKREESEAVPGELK